MSEVYLYSDITRTIIGCAHIVRKELGVGFFEKVYENALVVELQQKGLRVQQQYPITVFYKGQPVGEYITDILVEDSVIVELKVADAIAPAHENQLINYLRTTGKKVGLLINFGEEFEVRRKIYQTASRDVQGEN